MQFAQHQLDCNQLQRNSVSVLLFITLISFPSKIKTKNQNPKNKNHIPLFPWKQQAIKNPLQIYIIL